LKRDDLIAENQSLKRRIRQLSRQIKILKAATLDDPSPVEALLKARGIRVFRKNPKDRLFFPFDLSPTDKVRFYEMMKKYSFRLVLRDMIKNRPAFRIANLTRYCSSDVARGYCDFLTDLRAIDRNERGEYRVKNPALYSFGPTLEWFISEMFKREFASPSIYGVSLKKTPAGGDYDVFASWNRRLVYVEVKSSPPRGIEQSEISGFFSRIDDVLPEVALLFNDTQLRMKDKLVTMFEEELRQRYGEEAGILCPVERLMDELFHVRNRIFIVNSKKDVADNFRVCLNHYLRHATNNRQRP
jgi:hypothetical protein